MFLHLEKILFIQIVERDTKYSPVNFVKILMKSLGVFLKNRVLKDISKYASTCYTRKKSSRPSALHCVPEKKIIFIFRRQILAETASQKQSRLTTYCRHRATIRCALYVHTRAYAHVT